MALDCTHGASRPHTVRRSTFVLLAAFSLTACGSIMHDRSQPLGISSNPTEATVTIDGSERGKTPLIASLKRKDNHIIRIAMQGYAPFEATVTRKVSGWVWGNLVFGGVIGLAVDALSGGLYVLTPEQVTGQMLKQGASLGPAKNGVFVMLVRAPEPGWVKVGEMERE